MQLPERLGNLQLKDQQPPASFGSKDDEMPDIADEEDACFYADMEASDLPPEKKLPVAMELINTDPAKSTHEPSQIKTDSEQQVSKADHQSFIEAVKTQKIARIKEILDQFSENNSRANLLNKIDENGRTAVHYAAEIGNCEILKYLVRTNHARIVSNEWPILPLHLAAQHGHVEAIGYLVGHTYGNPDHTIKENDYTALHLAVEYNHYTCVIKLLKLGAMPLKKTKSGKSALELAKPGKIQDFLNALVPATQMLSDASCAPYCQKQDATYAESLRKYMGWRRTGENWKKFKQILTSAFENKIYPEVKDIIKMQCKTMVRSVGNKQASEQFLYYICVNGYHDIVDFLLNYGIDFTHSKYVGESSLAMKYLGLYCAIDACQLSVVEVLLKTNDRAQHYLHPKILLEEKTEERSRTLTPLEFAEKKFRTNLNPERTDEYKKIFQLIQRKSKEASPPSIAPTSSSPKLSPTIRKRQLDFSDPIEIEQFIPDIEPNYELSNFKIEKRDAIKELSVVPNTTQNSKKHDVKASTDEQQQLTDKNHRSIGIWGEAHLFFSLKRRYEKKYNMKINESSNETNSLILSQKSNVLDITPTEIEIEWPNKSKWEQWQKDKQDKFVDPGTQSYDLKVTKKYTDHTKEKYIEVKSTTTHDKSVAILTGKEFYFMRDHLTNYRFFRCYNVGKKEAYFIKYTHFDKLLINENSPVVELKFYI